MGGTITTVRFYLYGKSHFTKTGYLAHAKAYKDPEMLTRMSGNDLSNKVFLVTGANGGLGKELTQFLFSKGATVFMVCRDRQRAESAQNDIVAKVAAVASSEDAKV
jgi:dehydrogenase/reductase SDR family protein 12